MLRLNYDDGSSTVLPMTDEDATVSGYDKEQLGVQTIIAKYGAYTDTFTVRVGDLAVFDLGGTQLLQTRYNMGKQTIGTDLMIKNHGGASTNNRKGYVQFNLAEVKTLVENGGEIKSAKLIYNGKINNWEYHLKMGVYGVAVEKNLTNAQWINKAATNTAPTLGQRYGAVEEFYGVNPREVEVDVKEYIEQRITIDDYDTATFVFDGEETYFSSLLMVPVTGALAPKLIIEVE